MTDKKLPLTAGSSGQSLIFVLILSAVFGILGASLVMLFRYEVKFMAKQNCIITKQEVAAIALEHVVYKLQQGDNWNKVGHTDSDMAKYNAYQTEFKTDNGKYAIHIVEGNLFKTYLNLEERQSLKEYRTIGIKVKTLPLLCTGAYYAVVQKMKFGGPLVSKGKIDLPCDTTSDLTNANFYWGDIYSANTNNGYCRIPRIREGEAVLGLREYWLPRVYAKGDIYTSLNDGTNFGYTYDDMSPTAHCHPYSDFAQAPEIDLEFYRGEAQRQGSYYGPGGLALSGVTNANIVSIMAKLNSPQSVLFIDTSDTLPVRVPGTAATPTNTYCGTVNESANSLKFYVNNTNQYLTEGTCIILGPLTLIGHDPGAASTTGGYTWNYGYGTGTDADTLKNVPAPSNFYFPQKDDGYHYVEDTMNTFNSKLTNVKHAGLLYIDGQLRIGGPRVSTTTKSNICIYGTIYIGEHGTLNFNKGSGSSGDAPKLYVYYNTNTNIFGTEANTVKIITFNENTWLIPLPEGAGLEYPFPD